MARTAPVPNIPPIPGMCPSIAVLGGGGDGGGGSGKGPGSGSGDAGAGAGSGGDDATPDGRNAQSGSGASGGRGACPNHHAKSSGTASKGDPVDVVTGRVFTLPETDMELGGPLPLSIVRAYSSGARQRDVGLGYGWSHSLAWEIEVSRRSMRVWKWDGTAVELDGIAPNDGLIGPDQWVLARADSGFVLDPGDRTWLTFKEAVDGGTRYLLSSIEDRHGNRISLRYDQGRLVEILDSVGRVLRVVRTPGGRIAAFEVKNAAAQGCWVGFARYEYDEEGDLVAVTDALGHVTSYSYWEHLLVSHADPTGLTFSFRYDTKHRCVETWGEYPGKEDPSLVQGVPNLLADHETRAKGILHCKLEFHDDGYSEAVDSITTQRFFGNRFGKLDKAVSAGGVYSRVYDDTGHLLSFTDPLGATTSWERDSRGREVKIVDPLGRVTIIDRDRDGNIQRVVDPAGGVTEVTLLPDGLMWVDPIGAVFTVRQNRAGLITETVAPSGATTRFRYDVHGNMIEKVDAAGAVTRLSYDHFGRCTQIRDPLGASLSYAYDNRGDLVAERHPDGGVTYYGYDGARHLISITRPNGQTTTLVRGGYHAVCEIRRPNGEVSRFKYDREGRLIEVHNARGEVHAIELNTAGLVVHERTFDGREAWYGHDLAGRLTYIQNGAGEKTSFEHDLAGQLIARRYADDTADVFSYDLLGRIVSAERGAVQLSFEWNAVGWLTRETQVVDGDVVEIETTYDSMGDPVHRATSLGHRAAWARDAGGRCVRVDLDGSDAIQIGCDLLGREISRALPGGGRIDTAYDAMGRLSRRRVLTPAAQVQVAPGEPVWVGPRETGVTVDQAYSYGPLRELAERWDQKLGRTRFDHDPDGQLLCTTPEHGPPELFRYDETGNLFEATAGAALRIYGPGNRLLRKAGTDYEWDREGRLREARTTGASGDARATEYRWSAAGLLSSVRRHDGSIVEFMYDAFSRRVAKRALAQPSAGGPPSLVAATRFVWDRSKLVHEIKQTALASGNPVVEERTYCFDEDTGAPWAHRTVHLEGERRVHGVWFHYLNDDLGAPERLVGPDGSVACELRRTAWGKATAEPGAVTTTALRMRGQYHDEETGLSYNRYRYYDPELGRYISPDPIGLYGGLNGFSYAENKPTRLVDPNGLFPQTAVRKGGKTIAEGRSGGTDRRPEPRVKDDAVQQAVDKARENNPAAATSSHGECAEIDALHRMARDIRDDRRNKGLTKRDADEENAEIRKELQQQFKDGAKMETFDNDGNRMSPCTSCGQILRELGIHPKSPAASDIPRTGGIMGRDGSKWDGKQSQQGKKVFAKGNTVPSITPPFNER
jgi:RHS repeat-associated protein